MNSHEFLHDVMTPMAQVQKVILYKMKNGKEYSDMKKLFDILNKHINNEYDKLKEKEDAENN